MAERQYPLNIIIRAVDQITRPLRGMLGRVGQVTNGIRDRLLDLSNRSGLPVLVQSFRNVGTAVGDLAKRVATVGAGIAAMATAASVAIIGIGASVAETGERCGNSLRVLASRSRPCRSCSTLPGHTVSKTTRC
ncbi:hypothetical protein ACFSVK_07755 [Azorhizophilus paspali]|uniref:hypothetical protein n=1 Tax=Azorhizophilus paspali TaxID=69963 RepID=UPI00363A1417